MSLLRDLPQINLNNMLFWIIFIIDIILYFLSPSRMDKEYMVIILVMAVITIWCFILKRKEKERISKIQSPVHSIFFIICFCVVFFQCDLDYVFGLIDDTNNYLWINPQIVTKSLAISNLALISFMIGYNSNKKKNGNINTVRHHIDCSKKVYLAHMVSFFLLLYYLLVPKEYLNNGYGQGLDAGGVNAITSYLVAGFLAMMVIYSIDYNKHREKKWFKEFCYPIILVLIYMTLILVSGRRGEAIRIASLLAICYIYCNRGRINYIKLIFTGMCMLGVFSLIGVVRSLQNGNINESVKIISEYKSISPLTREIAGSVNTLHVATTYYPAVYEFNYGTTFIPTFFKIIPGLSSMYETFILNEPMQTSGDIITDLYFSGDPIWGLGSSAIADIYISYSTIGVCIVFLLFGYFVRNLEYYASGKVISPYLLALSFNSFASFMIVCRSSVAMLFLFWGYSCLILYVFTKQGIQNKHAIQ